MAAAQIDSRVRIHEAARGMMVMSVRKMFVAVLIGCCLAALAAGALLIVGFKQEPVLCHIVFMVALNLLFGIMYVHKARIRSPFTDIVIVMLLFFTLYAVAYPLDDLLGSIQDISEEQLLDNLQIFSLANLCLVAGMFIAGCFMNSPRRNNETIQPENALSLEAGLTYPFLFWPALIVLFIGACIMIFDFSRLGGWSVIGISNRMNNFQAQRQLEGLSLPWKSIMSSAMLMLALSIRGKWQFRFFLILMFSFSLFYFMGLGSRSIILSTFLPSLGVLIAKGFIPLNRRLNLLFFITLLLLLSPLFSAVRLSLMEDIPLSALPAKYWSFSAGETGSSFQVTMDITATNTYPEADATYTTAVAYVLPAAVYKAAFGHAKPKNLGDWYVWYFYPYIYGEGGGRGFSPVAQAWMNGQYSGVMIVFFIIGFLTMRMTRGRLLQYVCLPLVILFQRSSFHAVMSELLFNLAFIGCIMLLAAIMRSQHIRRQPAHSRMPKIMV